MQKFLCVLLVFLFCGCTTTKNVYVQPDNNEAYARIKFQLMEDPGKFFGDNAIILEKLNGQDLNFWRMSDNLRVSPGLNVFFVRAFNLRRDIFAVCSVEFNAEVGKTYYFKRDVNLENIRIYVVDNESNIVFDEKLEKIPYDNSTTYVPVIISPK